MTGESPAAVLALRVLTAVLALAPPTLLMGGTLPVLTRFAAAGRSLPGRAAGSLYAANTAGAVVGCFVTGCLLIFWLGVVETNIVAALVDLGVGAIALAWDRRSEVTARPDGGRLVVESVAVPAAGIAALLIATVSGFCGLAYELLWTRGLLAAITDDTTYAFTLMLTAFLAGHALGAAVASRTGGDQRPRRDWRRLGTAQILAALTALLSLPLLVVIRDPISSVSFTEGMTFWGARIPFHLAISLAVFAPSAAFLGASFALAARLYVGSGRPVGASTGRLYGLNTLGAILGAIGDHGLVDPHAGHAASDHSAGGLSGGPGSPGDPRSWRRAGWLAGAGLRRDGVGPRRRPRLRAQPMAPAQRCLRQARARQAPDPARGSGSHHHRAPAQPDRPGDLDQRRQRRRDQPRPPAHSEAAGPSSGLPPPIASIGPPDRLRVGRDLLLRQPALRGRVDRGGRAQPRRPQGGRRPGSATSTTECSTTRACACGSSTPRATSPSPTRPMT